MSSSGFIFHTVGLASVAWLFQHTSIWVLGHIRSGRPGYIPHLVLCRQRPCDPLANLARTGSTSISVKHLVKLYRTDLHGRRDRGNLIVRKGEDLPCGSKNTVMPMRTPRRPPSRRTFPCFNLQLATCSRASCFRFSSSSTVCSMTVLPCVIVIHRGFIHQGVVLVRATSRKGSMSRDTRGDSTERAMLLLCTSHSPVSFGRTGYVT